MKKLFGLLAFFIATTAMASSLYGTITVASHHFPNHNYNQTNPGVGVECDVDSTFLYGIGEYQNSFYHRSYYGMVGYTPYHYKNIGLGVFGGAVSGYKSPVDGGLLLTYRDNLKGFNVILSPMGTSNVGLMLGFQLVFQIPNS